MANTGLGGGWFFGVLSGFNRGSILLRGFAGFLPAPPMGGRAEFFDFAGALGPPNSCLASPLTHVALDYSVTHVAFATFSTGLAFETYGPRYSLTHVANDACSLRIGSKPGRSPPSHPNKCNRSPKRKVPKATVIAGRSPCPGCSLRV